MVLIWECNFIRAIDGEQKIMFSRAYANGINRKIQMGEAKEIFINYVTLFPNKDIVRIKLGYEAQYLYTFYYIDKTNFDNGFYGVFGVSENNTTEPFDLSEMRFHCQVCLWRIFQAIRRWANFISTRVQDYLNWLDQTIAEYYEEFVKPAMPIIVN